MGAGCQTPSKQQYFTLRVAIDNDEGFFLDSIYIKAPYQRDTVYPLFPTIEYDTLIPLAYYRFNKVHAGELTIYCQSQLNSIYEKKIRLQSDTSIIIRHEELPALRHSSFRELDIDSLAIGEKLSIAVNMSGCFNQYSEKILVERTQTNWKLLFTSTRQTEYDGRGHYTRKEVLLPAAFQDSLLQFSNSIKDFESRAPFGGCTTNYTYYVQKGNRFATLNDGTCSDFIRYQAILKLILPEWFKKNEGQ